jgi:hypothetical protein
LAIGFAVAAFAQQKEATPNRRAWNDTR